MTALAVDGTGSTNLLDHGQHAARHVLTTALAVDGTGGTNLLDHGQHAARHVEAK
jgi:hypothetical protein